MKQNKLVLENFIHDLIQKRKRDLFLLERDKEEYSKTDYIILFNRYHAGIDDLLISLTSFSNPLSQISNKDKIISEEDKNPKKNQKHDN